MTKTEIARRRVVFTALQYAGFITTENDPDITMTMRVNNSNNSRAALDLAIMQFIEQYNLEKLSVDGDGN